MDIREVERLLGEYEREVESARREGRLADASARTYILHATNFVRWIRGDFEPGSQGPRR